MSAEPLETELASTSAAAAPQSGESQTDWDKIELFFEQLFGELNAVRDEVQRKAHELQATQARLAEREQQLKVRSDEMEQLRDSLQRQEKQLTAAVAELAQLQVNPCGD
jgi:septal ring factor EnvC (AmiA/AmiB activator)